MCMLALNCFRIYRLPIMPLITCTDQPKILAFPMVLVMLKNTGLCQTHRHKNQKAGLNGQGNDVSDVTGARIPNLAPGESITVAFAILAGDNLRRPPAQCLRSQSPLYAGKKQPHSCFAKRYNLPRFANYNSARKMALSLSFMPMMPVRHC